MMKTFCWQTLNMGIKDSEFGAYFESSEKVKKKLNSKKVINKKVFISIVLCKVFGLEVFLVKLFFIFLVADSKQPLQISSNLSQV